MIGYPSTWDFLKLGDNNLIPNCPVGRSDIIAAEAIFGPRIHSLKGKTFCRGKLHVKSDSSPIPRDILLLYCDVALCVDIMYVNKIAFLINISRNIKFATIKLLANQQEDTIGKLITNVMQLYGSCGFLVNMTHADGEFKVRRTRLVDAGSGLNICSNAKHIPKIERYIRTVKERAQCMYNSVPFQCFPVLLIKEMVTIILKIMNTQMMRTRLPS
jgi:hypothetical protein